mgnify:FL=1
MTKQLIHPKCGQAFPNSPRYGHCAACCETFSGQQAFDAHRRGPFEGNQRYCEVAPYEHTGDDGVTRYGHWKDVEGYWHFGKRLTEEERQALWG